MWVTPLDRATALRCLFARVEPGHACLVGADVELAQFEQDPVGDPHREVVSLDHAVAVFDDPWDSRRVDVDRVRLDQAVTSVLTAGVVQPVVHVARNDERDLESK